VAGLPDAVREALTDLREGDDVIVVTWLDRADREVLRVHPRDDPSRAPLGVFSTRSADRPNPIGLHRVRVIAQRHLLGLITDALNYARIESGRIEYDVQSVRVADVLGDVRAMVEP
jgi:tRNA (Thr-GGU) A37 N-methylase